jgi:hypothetical protein
MAGIGLTPRRSMPAEDVRDSQYRTRPARRALGGRLNRPGGNITGVVFFSERLRTKRLELLRQLVPETTIAVLANLPSRLIGTRLADFSDRL